MAMGVPKLRVAGLCLLLLIMPLLSLPVAGEHGRICGEPSETYTSPKCKTDPCVEHCQVEGFRDGECVGDAFDPYKIVCFCKTNC